MSNNKIVRVGPFGKAKDNVEMFANNMYFNALYMQTLERFQEIQKEYDAALLDGDEDIIAQTLQELKFIEEVIKLSSINYDNYESQDKAAND